MGTFTDLCGNLQAFSFPGFHMTIISPFIKNTSLDSRVVVKEGLWGFSILHTSMETNPTISCTPGGIFPMRNGIFICRYLLLSRRQKWSILRRNFTPEKHIFDVCESEFEWGRGTSSLRANAESGKAAFHAMKPFGSIRFHLPSLCKQV